MKLFRRSKEESIKFVSNPGSRWYVERHGEVLPNGNIVLVEDRKIDIQEKYNAEFPATTIDNILANSNPLEYFGDDGTHGIDCTKIPRSLAEFMQLQIDRKREFDGFSAEVKQRFGNDFNQYLATAGSEEWFNKLGINLSSVNADQMVVNTEEGEVK